VYPPSSVRYQDTFSTKASSLPPQVTGRSYSARHTVVLSTPYGWIPVQAIRSATVKTPQKPQQKKVSMPTVQGSNLPRQGNPTFFGKLSRQLPGYDTPAFLDTPPEEASGVRYPTFPSKLPRASPTSHPVFLMPARVLSEKAGAQKQ